MKSTRKLPALLAGLLLLVCVRSAMAQETTATVNGQVTDQAGAVVSGAEIVLTNVSTREVVKTKSADDGYYSLSNIPPGVYDFAIKAQGFKEYLNKNVELLVNDRKTINVQLQTGAVTESVTVTAEAPIIQSTPTVGDAVENRRIVEMPLNNRNFLQLITLVPGVTADDTTESGVGLTSTTNIVIAGNRRNSTNYLVDGVSNVDVGSNLTLLSTPTVDSIQEFRVITSVPTAEYGRASGGVVNLVTRGGGRDFHGSLYEFFRNDKLNANSFLNNAAGRFCDSGDTAPLSKKCGDPRAPRPTVRYNNFGYTVSGPVWIPGIYSRGHDKTFFFFSEEWRRIIRQPTENFITVPSLRERNGDFSQSSIKIFDPQTGQQFPGNVIQKLDPTAVAFLKLFPEPTIAATVAGLDPNRVLAVAPAINNTRQETVRIDHNFSSNHRILGRYTHDLSQTREQGGLFFGVTVPGIATTDTNVPGQVLAITLTSSFGSNLVNELTFGWSGNDITTQLVGSYNKANVKIPNAELFPENKSDLPPTITISGFPTLGASQLYSIHYRNINPRDNLTWVRGAHAFKFGGDISWEKKDENAANETQGRFGFTGLQTRSGANSGIALADFLIGRASSYSESERDVTNHLRWGRTEFYGQDTWKARPNLQFDFGLRYQYYRLPVDKFDVLTAFLPELFDPSKALQCANATCTAFTKGVGDLLNGIAIANQNSPFGRRVQMSDKNNFAPRIGFAWSPTAKEGFLARLTGGTQQTVIRGGYGIYYDQVLIGILEQNTFVNPPFANSVSLTGTVATPITYANPTAGAPPGTLSPRSLITTTNPFFTPITQQWNLTIQRQLSRSTVFEIGYLGSGGNHQTRPVDINAPTPQEILAVSKGVAGCDPALSASNNPNNCINLARPFRGYTSITDRETTATFRYNALIGSFRVQRWHGLSSQLSYTWSKNLTDSTNDRDAADIPQIRTNFKIERAVARFDRTHVFKASYVYEMPYPKGGFMDTSLLRQIFGGWELAGITTAMSGLPLNRVVQGTLPGPRGNRPDQVSDPFQNIPTGVSRIPYYINPLAFRPTTVGAVGTSGRAPFRFQRVFETDLNVAKNWRWAERYRVQFRAEFFNVFNRVTVNDIFQTVPNLLPTDAAFTSLQSFLATGSQFGQVFATRRPREIQLALKFGF